MPYSQPLIIRTFWDLGNLVQIPNIRISKHPGIWGPDNQGLTVLHPASAVESVCVHRSPLCTLHSLDSTRVNWQYREFWNSQSQQYYETMAEHTELWEWIVPGCPSLGYSCHEYPADFAYISSFQMQLFMRTLTLNFYGTYLQFVKINMSTNKCSYTSSHVQCSAFHPVRLVSKSSVRDWKNNPYHHNLSISEFLTWSMENCRSN